MGYFACLSFVFHGIIYYILCTSGEISLNLKQIEMVGFKSFADPIKLTFEGGITAIVGPNGCGKSNVADAVRWVLGEQSSKTLRGTNMQDVIFKGTEKRKSLSFCEVSLLFDNSNHIFRVDYDEILITRKLFRSGESEYLINRNVCRLKDITDMLHDSGIGKNGYNIIGQGKVEEIINSKPEDRRVIFEEAAGIAKFKAKKTEAERKLERTQNNLIRINDIVTEIERQLGPLKNQADVAKKYLALKEDLKLQEVNAYLHQYDYSASNKEEISYKIDQLGRELQEKQKELESVIKNYNESFDTINNVDDDIAKLRDRVLIITVGMEKKAGEGNLLRERLRNCEAERDRLESLIKKFEKDLIMGNDSINKNSKLKEEKEQDLGQLKQKLTETEANYNKISDDLSSNENEAQEAQRKIFETLNKLGDVKAQISALEAEISSYNNQLEELEEGLKVTKGKLRDSCSVLKITQEHLSDLTTKINLSKTRVEDLSSKQRLRMEELKEVESRINEANNNLFSMHHRKQMLEDMQKEYEGYFGSVRRLLLDAENNQSLKQKIVGVLASLMKVPRKYEIAIEMALGSAVQNIVTYTEIGAKELVGYLKSKEYGRATFLPITSVKPRELNGYYSSSLRQKGVIGVANKLISYDKQIADIVSNLLGSTVICEDLNYAVEVARSSDYGFRIVTLDGDIISPQGSITGGSKKAQIANLLSRKSNIDEVQKVIEKFELDLEQLKPLQAELVGQVNSINEQLRKETEELKTNEISRATENERCDKLSQMVNDLDAEQNGIQGNIAKAKQILNSIRSEQEKIILLKENYSVSSINVEKSEFSDLRKKRDEYSLYLANIRVEMAQTETAIQTASNEIYRLTGDLKDIEVSLEENRQKLLDNNKILQTLSEIKEEAQSRAGENEVTELEEAKKKLASLDEYKEQLQISLRHLEDDRMELSGTVNRIQDKKYQQELNLGKIDSEIEAMQERVWSEYELTYESAKDYRLEDYNIKNGMTLINKLKRDIIGLGNVNVNAIEDCKALEERYGNMYDQAQDLIQAENDLKKIISELSTEMESRFEEEFNHINENFGKVFKEFFGGGMAKLQLTQSENSLEAGVDIIAEPPGKKLSNITLLSGGEKALTAIAILFAILRLKPMPFCLLDEIEAALDEANADRFARYLEKYCDETQFVVITHKKPTMEHAGSLYGVTMEEKGVSKVVSVKLTEALKNTEQAG